MHARELVSISALLTATSSQLANSARLRQHIDVERWNHAYQALLARWSSTLDLFDSDLTDLNKAHNPWPAIGVVAEEVLLSEVYIRLVAAAITVSHSSQDHRSVDHAVRAAWIGHLAARRRVLALILCGRREDEQTATDLDRLRTKIERWTDALLSRFQQLGDVSSFAFDAERVNDFADDSGRSSDTDPHNSRRWELLCLSVRDAFAASNHKHPANPKLISELAHVLRGCLSHMELDRNQSGRLPWLSRLNDHADEMDDLIGEYFRFAS